MITRYLAVGAGGFLGAIARYALGVWFETAWRRPFPLATLLVNLSGCFIIGAFLTAAAERLDIGPMGRLFVATGFVGAYTTFSTFEYENYRLTQTGAWGWALLNVAGSVVAGFMAVRLGVLLVRR